VCLALLLAWVTAVPASALAADAALTVSVPAGKHKAVRLRNLPKDAVIGVAVRADGKLAIGLLNERDYRSYPRASEPVFVGSVDQALSFQVVIPANGAYYLVLDNRRGAQECKVKLAIRAKRGVTAPEVPEEQPQGAGPRQGT
jgi:hypothetical protein